MKKRSVCLTASLLIVTTCFSQVDKYVEVKTSSVENEAFGIVKLDRRDNHIKVKYFAAKDTDGTHVFERYTKWAANKKVILVSSGTYMDECHNPAAAEPIGLCIDEGVDVNRNLITGKLDALAIVYATGGMVVSNLKEGNLSITYPDKSQRTLDMIKRPGEKTVFIAWAQQVEATVFQTHLFVYKDEKKIAPNAPVKAQERRFLGVCRDDAGNIVHYIINLPTASPLYKGVDKAYKILKEMEEVNQIVFMINLDTGCQNVFSVFNSKSVAYSSPLLNGTTSISNSVNLLAYYYE